MDISALSSILISSFCTMLGVIPLLFINQLTHRRKDSLLAFTAGVMVAASTYGLIPAAMKLSNVAVLSIGILAGALVLSLLERFIPHTELDHRDQRRITSGGYLLLLTMIIHNLPEGLSVGVSFASRIDDLGPIVAFAIGMQNIPEGFLLSLFLMTQGAGKLKAIFFTGLAAISEFLAGFFGFVSGGQITGIVPYGLAFAAGAMLFVVYKELIPESHGDGNERLATLSFILGFLAMILLTSYLR